MPLLAAATTSIGRTVVGCVKKQPHTCMNFKCEAKQEQSLNSNITSSLLIDII